jgi:hypothetical protein
MAKKKSRASSLVKPLTKAPSRQGAGPAGGAAAGVPEAAVAAVPIIPIPLGQPVQLEIPHVGVSVVVRLDEVVVDPTVDPPGDTFDLTPLSAGDHTLRWLITPISAPWSFAVTLVIGGQPLPPLDEGAGNTVSNAVGQDRILRVS